MGFAVFVLLPCLPTHHVLSGVERGYFRYRRERLFVDQVKLAATPNSAHRAVASLADDVGLVAILAGQDYLLWANPVVHLVHVMGDLVDDVGSITARAIGCGVVGASVGGILVDWNGAQRRCGHTATLSLAYFFRFGCDRKKWCCGVWQYGAAKSLR